MRLIVDLPTLAVWARKDAAAVAADPFAQVVLDAVSIKVAETAGHPEWIDDLAADLPAPRAKIIASMLAMRSYNNPDSIVGEGGVGPIGGDRYVEDLVRFLELTDAETEELEAMAPDDPTEAAGGLYTVAITSGPARATSTVWVPTLFPQMGAVEQGAFPMGDERDAAAYGL